MKQHGITKNEVDNNYEAWCNGVIIGKISCNCQQSTIDLWKSRYNEYLGLNERK